MHPSGFVVCRTENRVSDMLDVVTLLVRIIIELVRVVACTVCVVDVLPLEIVVGYVY